MLSVVSSPSNLVIEYSEPGQASSSGSSLVKPRPNLADIPAHIRDLMIFPFLSSREHHIFKTVLKGASCPCDPLCKLVHDAFTTVVFFHTISSRIIRWGGEVGDTPPRNESFTAFAYEKRLGLVLVGDRSDKPDHPGFRVPLITVFNAKGEYQFAAQNAYWDGPVLALKHLDEFIIAFGSRELGIWKADGKPIGEYRNRLVLKTCVFSKRREGAYVAGFQNSDVCIGYFDFSHIAKNGFEDPWESYLNFNNSTHTGNINWIKEDSLTGYVLSGCSKGIVNVWNHDFQLVCSIETAETCGKYVYQATKQLLFASLDSSTIGVWDANGGGLKKTLSAAHPLAISANGISALDWNEEKNSLYAVWEFMRAGGIRKRVGRALIWWDIESGEEQGKFLLVNPKDGVYYFVNQIAFSFSADNNFILTSGYEIQLWDETGKLLNHIEMRCLSKFEWDQENKKIFILTEHDSETKKLSILTY